MDTQTIQQLVWPKDKALLSRLGIVEFQTWYVAQDMKQMIVVGQSKEFKRFVFYHYTIPVKLLRLYYKIRRMF